jgi:hypothetical protein
MTTSRRQALTHVLKLGLATALPVPFIAHGQDKDNAGTGAAAQNPLQPHLNSPRLVGQGKYIYWGFDVYWASLWSEDNPLRSDQWHTQRLALELRYLRDFDGKDIAKRSVDEMHKQSPLAIETATAWLKALEALFPNIRKGQSLTGIYVPNSSAPFLFNNQPLGKITDAELAKRFFAIWLSPQTSAPELRKKLFAE